VRGDEVVDGPQFARLVWSEALLAEAEQLADLGSWELDIEARTLNCSAHFYCMLGLEPETGFVPYGRGIEMIHPDDRERALRDAEQVRACGLPLDNELRFVRSDGSVRIFHSRAIGMTDEAGKVVRIRGMSQDVTDRKGEEERLRKSEALLSQAEEMANFGSWDFDVATQTATLSKHLLQMYGMASEAEWTPNTYWDRLHPKDREKAFQIVNGAIAACKPFEHVSRYITPDGRVRVHFVRGLPIPGADGKAAHSIGVVQDITNQLYVENELRRLSQELMRARDEERRRMARELHESVGQSLAALKMSLGWVRETLGEGGPQAREYLKSATAFADDAVRQVRTISYLMHPPMLDDLGLGSALRWYARGFGERSGIKLKVEIADDLERQTQEVETAMFRIVQEALTNVHRYSGTQTATVRLTHANGYITVEVRDEGCGIPFNGFSQRNRGLIGVGIQGMRERVKELKGTFEIDSAAGKGTTVRVTLPCAPANPWMKLAEPKRIRELDANLNKRVKRASG
jgi:PAS domain S-box-containing protein